ncbi:unnamed protein product [Urochloa humidicola]
MQTMEASESSAPRGNTIQPSALELLEQGIQQTIHIPLNTILVEVMTRMPGKEPPTFRCTRFGASRYEVTVELNVSGFDVAKIVGEISTTSDISMLSACKKALEYLGSKHFVQIIDYSSKVVDGYACKNYMGDMDCVGHIINKVLNDWVVVIYKIQSFHAELQIKEDYETTDDGRTGAGDVYAQTKDFVDSVLSKYLDKEWDIKSKLRELERKRSKYINDAADKVNNYRMKGSRQSVDFSVKHVLSSVLDVLGLKAAEYSNEPVGRGEFIGQVIVHLPDVENARCGGRTKFNGELRYSAAKAEEHAAYKALRYMEANLKLTIMDINYPERLEAEANHEFRLNLLRSMVGLARNVLDDWCKMNERIDDGVYIYGGDRPSITLSTLSHAEIVALKFCEEGFAKLQVDCKSAYQIAVGKMKYLDKYKESDEEYGI